MVALRTVWACYGPAGAAALPDDARVVIHGLRARPELNGTAASLVRWDGLSGRFVVALVDSQAPEGDEKLKVRAANLKVSAACRLGGLPAWAQDEGHLGPLPIDICATVACCLDTDDVARLSAAARGTRAALWLRAEAELLWEELTGRLGSSAPELARRARPGDEARGEGPQLCRTALGLQRCFGESLEVVRGSVVDCADGCEVVACPCIRGLQNVGVGAQGAVRRAAGLALERAVARVPTPVEELSVTLVPGGGLSKWVAMTVTEPPRDLWATLQGSAEEQVRGVIAYLDRLHVNLVAGVREAGLRSLAMPTLCTGGVGMPPHLVAIASVRAAFRDFCAHPSDPVRLRVCCFEEEHARVWGAVKGELLRHFFEPEWASEADTFAAVFFAMDSTQERRMF